MANRIKVGDIFFTRETMAGKEKGWIVLQVTRIEEGYYYWGVLKAEKPKRWEGIYDCNWDRGLFEKFGCIKLDKKDWEKKLLAYVI